MTPTPPMTPEVARVFENYPDVPRAKLLALRQLIYDTASATEGVGPITETLKWGEPAYLTAASKSGSTIRIGWKSSRPDRYGIYFNCSTSLVDGFRQEFPEAFMFEGNRALTFEVSEEVPAEPLAVCIAMALTYHRAKRQKPRS